MVLLTVDIIGLIKFLMAIMFVPPLILTLIGLIIRKDKPKAANIFFILAGLYLLIGGGVCGIMLNS